MAVLARSRILWRMTSAVNNWARDMKIKLAVAIAALAMLQGCATHLVYQAYEGELGKEERARLIGTELPTPGVCVAQGPIITFASINGESTYQPQFDYHRCLYPTEALLAPGETRVVALYSYGGSPQPMRACFIAEAGKTYKAIGLVDGYQVNMQVVDAEEPRVVAERCD